MEKSAPFISLFLRYSRLWSLMNYPKMIKVTFSSFKISIRCKKHFIGKCLNKLKLDICICSSQDITIALCLVMTLALISFVCFFSSLSMPLLVFHLQYHCILLWLIRLTNCPKMGWGLSQKRRENTWFSRTIK